MTMFRSFCRGVRICSYATAGIIDLSGGLWIVSRSLGKTPSVRSHLTSDDASLRDANETARIDRVEV